MPSPRSYSSPAVSPIAIRQPTLGSVKMYVGLSASAARFRRSFSGPSIRLHRLSTPWKPGATPRDTAASQKRA